MSVFSRLQKVSFVAIGALSGIALFYHNAYGDRESAYVQNSWTTNFTPSVKWDHNWDRRDPKSLIKVTKANTEIEETKYNEEYAAHTAKQVRHLILIRHGQYNTAGKTDPERVLTELGQQQAEATGKRLAAMRLRNVSIVRSTMQRAQETSKIIEKSLTDVPIKDDSLLIEGAPIPPEPPIGSWTPERYFYEDGPRIEAAFRKYVHRADPKQDKDTCTILVCHGNLIRYFVCRALQFPPEAWMRMRLNHASITWLCIHPTGRVTLLCLGDTGHIEPEMISAN